MASANRLPPSKHEVSGCSSCPLRVVVDEDTSKCGHPGDYERDVSGEEGVPDFCPLIRAPLLLVLDPEAQQ